MVDLSDTDVDGLHLALLSLPVTFIKLIFFSRKPVRMNRAEHGSLRLFLRPEWYTCEAKVGIMYYVKFLYCEYEENCASFCTIYDRLTSSET